MGINLLAVLACAVVSMIIGSIWYGPLFGSIYTKAMGWSHKSDAEKKQMQKAMMWSYVGQFIASLVMFYVLARFMNATGLVTTLGGVVVALWAWFGFIVPLKLGDALWGGKMTLFWLGISNSLLTLVAGGALLGLWR
ncbi:MAG TPA: DUF1761 domain-containing protein [Candidatus Paceibacterota bacterium]|nr:DUF1761 domain-containing protein [Candidatus Paceibacterota bacterium]